MYAVIKSGGKQYKVKAGEIFKVEKIEKQLGEEFSSDEVLFVGGSTSFVGEPSLSNAKVTLVVTQHSKFPKILVFKKKRRKGFRKMKGHRQPYTELFVKSITTPDGKVENASMAAPIKDSAKKIAQTEVETDKLATKKVEKTAAKTAKVASAKKVDAAESKPAKKAAVKTESKATTKTTKVTKK